MSPNRFDQAAATWDEQPRRIALAKDIAAGVLRRVPVNPAMTAIDFGCGTGLVTLALQPFVKRIIGVDSSAGMLAKLREKAAAMGVDNVEALALDLETQAPHGESQFAVHETASGSTGSPSTRWPRSQGGDGIYSRL